jgi:error-prone DNA polymerase
VRLLAASREGYTLLSAHLTRVLAEGALPLEALLAENRDLVLLTGGREGFPSRLLAERCLCSLAEFRARLDPPQDLLLALARAGAFDELLPRREALYQAGLPGGGLLPLEEKAPPLPPLGLGERLFLDLEAQGLSALPLHPMDLLRGLLEELGVTPIPLLEAGPARTAGLVVARQKPPTVKGYAFLVLEDGPHRLQAVIPPEVWEQHYALFRNGEALLLEGVYQGRSLRVERAWSLPLRGLQEPQGLQGLPPP